MRRTKHSHHKRVGRDSQRLPGRFARKRRTRKVRANRQMVTNRLRRDRPDLRLPPRRRDKDGLRQARQVAKLPVLPLTHHPQLEWTIGHLSLVKHHRYSTFPRPLQTTQHPNKPRTVAPLAIAKGIILDHQPIDRSRPPKQLGKPVHRLRLLQRKKRMHLDPFIADETPPFLNIIAAFSRSNSPDTRLHTSPSQGTCQPVGIVSDPVKVRRESSTKKSDTQSKSKPDSAKSIRLPMHRARRRSQVSQSSMRRPVTFSRVKYCSAQRRDSPGRSPQRPSALRRLNSLSAAARVSGRSSRR